MNVDREDLSADFAELLAALPEGDRGKKIVRLGETVPVRLAKPMVSILRRSWRSSKRTPCGGRRTLGQRRSTAPRVKEPGGALPRSDDFRSEIQAGRAGEVLRSVAGNPFERSARRAARRPRPTRKMGHCRDWSCDAAASMSAYGSTSKRLTRKSRLGLTRGDGEAGEPAFGLEARGPTRR